MKALNPDFFFESLISLSYLLAASVRIHSEFFSKQSAPDFYIVGPCHGGSTLEKMWWDSTLTPAWRQFLKRQALVMLQLLYKISSHF